MPGAMNDATSLALADVERAFTNLEFAIKLMCYVELGHIDHGKFDTDVTILLETENVGFSANKFESLESLISVAQAQVGVAFGVTAIVLDAAFEVAGIKRHPESMAPNDLLRTLVFMVRSAFAHNPAAPCWEVRGPYLDLRALTVQLEGETITVQLSQLHGSAFDYAHIGGLANWCRVRRVAEKLIKGA
jgi:hypothetical protein